MSIFDDINAYETKGVFWTTLYIDKLSLCLKSENTGCRRCRLIINHLLFADDAVVFAPSAKGLQRLLDICSMFAVIRIMLSLMLQSLSV